MLHIQIAEVTEGYSGADVELLCREAAMKPVRRLMDRLRNVPEESLPTHPRGTALHVARGNASAKAGLHATIDASSSIDAMLKADPVSVEDCAEALQTTKPASKVSQHSRWQGVTCVYYYCSDIFLSCGLSLLCYIT